YPLTHGLSMKVLGRLARQAVESLPELPEWIPESRRAEHGWPSFKAAMTAVHNPGTPTDAELSGPARMRLAYDEYFAGQLALMIVRSRLVAARGIARSFTGAIT